MDSPKSLATKNNSLFVALLLLVFLLPWPHGGEILWQYLFFAMGFFILLGIYVFNNRTPTLNDYSSLSRVKTPLTLLSGWLIYSLLQSLPLPLSVVELVNPEVLNIQPALNDAQLDIVNGEGASKTISTTRTLSIAPAVSLAESLKHASYLAVFIFCLLLLNTRQRILQLLNVLFASSAIIALYSVINVATNGAFSFIESSPPWNAPWSQVGHGTFSYQNHYASFLTLTIPLGFALMYANTKNSNNSLNDNMGRSKLQYLLDFTLSINVVYLVAMLIMIIALITTSSRGGNMIFIISLITTLLSVLVQQKHNQQKGIRKKIWGHFKTVLLALVALMVLICILSLSGISDSLDTRLSKQGFAPSGRDIMHQTAFNIIKDYPLVGSGAGTYPIIQHKYKSPELGNTAMSKRAHNEYLELLANQGIIGFGLLAAAIGLLLSTLFAGLKQRRQGNGRGDSLYGVKVASYCAVTTILMHSLADFNFHLPVNVVYFYAIIAIGINVKHVNKKRRIST
jgi:O-antigen ligase